VSICNVADICPVEQVGVVTNLEVRAAFFEDLGEARDSLAVTWSVDKIVLSVVIMRSSPPRELPTYPKMPAGRRATVSKPSVPLAARTSSSAFALDSLYASSGFSGNGIRSSTLMRSWPLKTTPAELVYTSLGT
jgi:hypothetical protein